MSEETAPRPAQRMTLSRVVEMMMTRGAQEHASVTLSRNATGATLVEVTARDESDPEAAAVKARAVYDALCAEYPVTNGHDAADITLTRNAKGETQITVTAKTGEATPTLQQLADSTRKVYDGVRMKYPMAAGTSAKPGSVA